MREEEGLLWMVAFKCTIGTQMAGVRHLRAWISVDLQDETVVSLGNALPTETATAAVDSCPVLQARTNESGESGKRAALLPREWKV